MRSRINFSCIALIATATLSAAAGDPSEDSNSLTPLVPADAGLYLELRNADDLLIPLTEPQVWLTLAELAGQRANPEDAEAWRRQIEKTVQMDPPTAIRTLFKQRVAFVGRGPGRSQDAAVLCRPAAEVSPSELLSRLGASPHEKIGVVEVRELPMRVGVSVVEGALIFGDLGPAGKMFEYVVRTAGAPPDRRASLARDADFLALASRLPREPDGVLFARLRPRTELVHAPPDSAPISSAPASGAASRAVEPSTTQPAGGRAAPEPPLPGSFHGAANILMALQRADRHLHVSVVGDGHPQPPPDGVDVVRHVRGLPARTLVAWAGGVNFAELVAAVDGMPERSVARVVVNMQRHAPALDELRRACDGTAALAVGVVPPAADAAISSPPVPALAVLIGLKQEHDGVSAAFGNLVETTTMVHNLMALRPDVDLPRLLPPETIELAGRQVQRLDLSELVRRLTGGLMEQFQFCWTIDGDALILTTHEDWLRQILVARQRDAADLSLALSLLPGDVSPSTNGVVLIQTGPISDLGALWLRHLERHVPAILQEQWWRQRQPGGGRVRLGIAGVQERETNRLRLDYVDPAGLAAGVLEKGDYVVGCNERPFATSQPFQELQRGLEARPHARRIVLDVIRGDRKLRQQVSIPFVDPIQVLRRAVAIGQIAQRVVCVDDGTPQSGSHGLITIELRRGDPPLFAFESPRAPQPIGAATSGPAPASDAAAGGAP
ncbi:MAG: hypothetical protein CHACPFDD_00732 [Phycisphaerae bacterium]|nr:hypothetical protein [Phycisphaerae bacterium]